MGDEQLPLAQNHFYTQKRVQKWSFLKTCFKQYDYQNGTYILTHRPYKCSYLLRIESTESAIPRKQSVAERLKNPTNKLKFSLSSLLFYEKIM